MDNDLEVDQPSRWVVEENEDLLVKVKENFEEVDGKPQEKSGEREISAVESGVEVEKGAQVPYLKGNQDQGKEES